MLGILAAGVLTIWLLSFGLTQLVSCAIVVLVLVALGTAMHQLVDSENELHVVS